MSIFISDFPGKEWVTSIDQSINMPGKDAHKGEQQHCVMWKDFSIEDYTLTIFPDTYNPADLLLTVLT